MRLDAFRDYLDIHGSDPDAWPAGLAREEARALLRRSAEARGMLEAAARLDALLARTLSAGTAGADLRDRILAGLPARADPAAASPARPAPWRPARPTPWRPARPTPWWRSFTLPWRIGTAAAAAALLFGIYAGASGMPSDASFPAARADGIVDVADLAYGAGFYEDTLP